MPNIERYLPPFLREYKEFQSITHVENQEFDQLWSDIHQVKDDLFVTHASEQGLSRWEKILKIQPKDTEGLDVRRFRVLSRLNQQLPYSYRNLEARLKVLCGSEGYTLALEDGYKLSIRVALGNKGKFTEVKKLAEKMVPANMLIDLSIKYNPYSKVEQFTYRSLSSRTYEQIRSEVIV